MKILVTGTAGFIGNAVALRLLDRGGEIVGVDNVNPYYDPALKEARLARIKDHPRFTEARISLEDQPAMERVFDEHRPRRVVHLAAQAGVRYSLENPRAYIDSNIVGFLHVLEGCRRHLVEHLLFASTSSVYGANTKMPFSEHHSTEHPLTLYAATKKANEMMAHSYAHLYGIPSTGLRFFTVYGPWGRPDMALFKFTKAILAGEPIEVYNFGKHSRSFTYIDDVVEGVLRALDKPPGSNPDWDGVEADPAASSAPYRLYNIGNRESVPLFRYIEVLEECMGKKAERLLLPMQPGDVPDTESDVSDLEELTGYSPAVPLADGVARFVAWYTSYFATDS